MHVGAGSAAVALPSSVSAAASLTADAVAAGESIEYKASASGAESSSSEERSCSGSPMFFISSFFIGLSFRNGLRTADVTMAVQDFLYRVNIYDGKKPGMEISVEVGACFHL